MQILIADDHDVVRAGIATMLEGDPEIGTVHQFGSFHAAAAAMVDMPLLDVAIVDLFMPDASPSDGVAMVRRARPEVPVIVLSGSEEREDIENVFRLGVMAYIPKSMPVEVFKHALNLVRAGFRFVPGDTTVTRPDAVAPARPTLTDRQRQILRALAEGKSNKDIASSLGLSVSTVKTHVESVFKALDATNRTQAVAVARQQGLLNNG